MPRAIAYPIEGSSSGHAAAEMMAPARSGLKAARSVSRSRGPATAARRPRCAVAIVASEYSATTPPWSAAHAFTNLYGPKNPTTATIVGNYRVTEAGTDSDTHHVVLDFGSMPFPVLEGQSVGILPPGTDAAGRAHHARSTRSQARATASGGYKTLRHVNA